MQIQINPNNNLTLTSNIGGLGYNIIIPDEITEIYVYVGAKFNRTQPIYLLILNLAYLDFKEIENTSGSFKYNFEEYICRESDITIHNRDLEYNQLYFLNSVRLCHKMLLSNFPNVSYNRVFDELGRSFNFVMKFSK